MRGKKRDVVEVLGRERVCPEYGPGYYRVIVRLSCGHVVRTQAHNRYNSGGTPVVGYCMNGDCLAGKVAA
jgi:hypothetical protein